MYTPPLLQLMLKSRHLRPLFAHCLSKGSRPRLTVSSHRACDGDWIWYLGGELAETGAQLSHTELVTQGQAELAQLFPWLDWQQDRKSTRLNSSHVAISYAVFCLKKKN